MNWEDDWYLKHPIAHRGLHQGENIPENSLSSFRACIEKSLPIELDVHIMHDGTALVFHDDTFERMTGYHRDIYLSEYKDVVELKLLKSEEKIPTLEEVLKLVDGEVPLVIELKCLKHDGRLEHSVYNLLREYHGIYCVQSFNPFTLLWFKRFAPQVPRGLLAGSYDDAAISFWQKLVLKSLVFAFMIRPHYIGFEWNKLWYPSVFFFKTIMRIPFIAWVVTNKSQQQFLKGKTANIIFENFDPIEPK